MSSVEQLAAALATAKKAHKANKADAGLKKAYKAAKAAHAAGVAAAAAKAEKKAKKASKKRKAEESVEAPQKKQKSDVDSLKAAAAAAKAAYKANKTDETKAAHKAAKKALAEAEAAAANTDTPMATEEAPAAEDDVLAGLKKKSNDAPAGGNAGLSGPKPSADHEGNPPNAKVFVGNLSWDIDDDLAKDYFKECGETTEIHWLMDKESGKFKGCGFITFESVEAAAKAVLKNGQDCMGRDIRVNYAKPSTRGGGGKGGGFQKRGLSPKPEGCTTVFAGNLSFDIDEDKMKEFASDCGDVKNIRWLTDRDSGDFKGCGFIEFYDGSGVDEFVKKNGQDLLGRAIRLDYAAPRNRD